MNILYIFVDIAMDLKHLIQSIQANFDSKKKIALVATIQFVASLRVCNLYNSDTFLRLPRQNWNPILKI